MQPYLSLRVFVADAVFLLGKTKYSNFKLLYLSNRALFPCLHSLIYTRGGLGEFETVMQTRDVVEGMHNFREFFQLPSV